MIPSSIPKLSDLHTLSQSKLLENYTPGGGYSREFWIGVCREGSWTLALFKD